MHEYLKTMRKVALNTLIPLVLIYSLISTVPAKGFTPPGSGREIVNRLSANKGEQKWLESLHKEKNRYYRDLIQLGGLMTIYLAIYVRLRNPDAMENEQGPFRDGRCFGSPKE